MSHYALDKFVAQDLSQLTECRAAPIAAEFPDYQSWLSSFILTSMFRHPLSEDKAALAFALIRRAEAAISDYEEARAYLSEFVAGNRDVGVYFRSLRKFESAVSVLCQALLLVPKALGKKLFKKGDGSSYDQLNLINNKIKHADPEALPAGHLHVVWLKNEGLIADGASLPFDELRDLLHQIARQADWLANR